MSELQSIMRSRTAIKMAICLVTAATAYGLWTILSGPNLAKYAPVIADLSANKLADDGVRIDLSSSFPGLTPHDEIFITHRTDGSFVVLFPDYYAKGPIVAGLMYTSRPLQDGDTYTRARGVGFDQQFIIIGHFKRMAINRKIDDHWYNVSYGME